MRLVIGIACMVAICACGTARRPVMYEWRVSPPPPSVTFAAPATHYNQPVQPPPSTMLGDLILGEVREAAARAGQLAPVADERLFLASAALAAVVPEDGVVPYSLVEFALQSNGVIEPSPQLLVVWSNLRAPRGGGVAEALQPALETIFRNRAVARIGVGAVERGRLGYSAVVVTLLVSRVRTAPIPRTMSPDATVEIELSLDPELQQPWIGVTMPSGIVKMLASQPKSADKFSAQLDCGGRTGKMVVEILARGEDGDYVAKFPVWCGLEPPRTFKIVPSIKDVPVDPDEGARQIFELVNLERKTLGRRPVLWDETLAQAAREHSQEMLRTNVVSSRIPGGQSIQQRVKARRNDLKASGNVARAYGIAEAHQGLIDLPSTRERLISDAATRFGVGIAYGPIVAGGLRELFVTQVVAAPAPDLWGGEQ